MPDSQALIEKTNFAPWSGGRTVGRYTLLAKLATGGMAEIFLARQAGPKGFEKLVVVKKILDTYAEDPDFVAMFLDEARIAAQLNHPNIVQIFDLGEDQGAYYIAMEYLAGESVSMLARTCRKLNQPLPVAMSARLISVAAEALHYAHQKVDSSGKPLGIVHRDISPQNLFVTYEGALKVVDFGIAKAANKASHTQDGHIKGKLSYMSPEQARGEDVDPRSDVFALGIVLFELATGTRLFQFDDPIKTFSAVVGPALIPRAHERLPDLDPALDAIIAKALERDVHLRYASGAELHQALEQWLRTQEAQGTSAISAFMTGLFADRINQRQALVERANQGEEISSGISVISRREDTDRSMPGGTNPSLAAAQSAANSGVKTSHLAAGVAVGLALLGVGGIAAYLTQPKAAAPLVVATPSVVAPTGATLTIHTDPPHARITVDGVDKGVAPLSIPSLALGDHAVVARLEGRLDRSRVLKLDTVGQSLDVEMALESAPAAVEPPKPESAKVDPTPSAPAKAARHKGRLTLDTVPWTRVSEGAKELGDTPLVEVKLSEGSHRLRLQNPDKKIDMAIEVTVTADQLVTKKLRL